MVFTIHGHDGHLGHVTNIMSTDFHFRVPESVIQYLVQIGTVVSEKIHFDFLYIHNLGPRSESDLDQYSHIFIYSMRSVLLPTVRSLAAIVSKKYTVFTFSNRKAKVTKFDLAVK